MNKFSWYEAQSVEDATAKVNTTVSEEIYNPSMQAAVFKAGGVDLLDMIKEGLIHPEMIVNVRHIPGLDQIDFNDNADLVIGANVTLSEIEENKSILENYFALHQAVAHAATPQLRNMSTLAGNLAQRTRCWYFRSIDHSCFRKGGDRCFARHSENGQNENHAILENGSCVSVHASSIATALLAYDASVMILNSKGEEKEWPLAEFFVSPGNDPSRENILEPGDLMTEIRIPKQGANVKSFYIKQVARESYDWSIADVAVVASVKGGRCENARIVLGSAAPVPVRSPKAEQEMENKEINDANALKAAKAAMEQARPLSMNGYKVPLFESIIKRALLELV
ncbi:MAG: molybdopterin-binding protein [Saprospiraceae bacterium]|nr:molybdopterin-binding protein [Saprospiraceae bacterium]